MIIKLVLLSLIGAVLSAELPAQDCPLECSCYYTRINWVTDCSHRGLQQIPITGLSSDLYSLDLRNNRLDTLVLSSNIKARLLLLSNNNFRHLTKTYFKNLPMLLEVDLSGNKLETIDADSINNLRGLIKLRLKNNLLLNSGDNNEPFLMSRTLQKIDLSSCGFTKIGSNFFSQLTSLHKIDLSNNPITNIDSNTFYVLPSLEKLVLSNTKITELSSTLSVNSPIRILDISKTNLYSSDLKATLHSLAHLESLDITNTLCIMNTEEHGDAFKNTKYLQDLKLSGNSLKDLDITTSLGNLKYLETLDLSYCKLESASFTSDSLNNLTRLRTINLSGNNLNTLNMTALLEPLNKLNTLIVKNCSLESTEFLRELTPVRQSLRSLDLSNNPLGDEQVNEAGSIFPHLESLDVTNCNLNTVSNSAFSSATNLINLAISNNPFTRLERGALSKLTKLQYLYMENCGLQSIPNANVFPNLVPLSELRMAGNPLNIEKIPLIPVHLSNITLLDVSRCNIKTIHSKSIKNGINLEKLILSNNPLDELPINIGTLLSNLKTLDIKNCKLEYLDPVIFNGSEHLTQLFLNNNPWKCNCNLLKLWKWATSKGIALEEDDNNDMLRCDDTNETWSYTLDHINCMIQ